MNELLPRLYEAEKRLPEPNSAKAYSFEYWVSLFTNDNGFSMVDGVRVPWHGKTEARGQEPTGAG